MTPEPEQLRADITQSYPHYFNAIFMQLMRGQGLALVRKLGASLVLSKILASYTPTRKMESRKNRSKDTIFAGKLFVIE